MKILYSLMLVMAMGCTQVEYSPYQVFDNDSPRNLNISNIERLKAHDGDDTITIAFIGDSQRFYDEIDWFVSSVNTRQDVDVVFLAGDISDFGLLQELEWVNERLEKLHVPYLAVIGNHDVVGNGEKTFENFFGPLNFSFVYKDHKFIFHNTNGREYTMGNVPDLDWLAGELADDGPLYQVGVSHVPPYDGDFDDQLEQRYASMLRMQPNFILSLHGHQHRHTDTYHYEDGVRYLVGNDFGDRQYVLIKLIHGKVIKSLQQF